jgi:ABC-type sugar transport system permease subunit
MTRNSIVAAERGSAEITQIRSTRGSKYKPRVAVYVLFALPAVLLLTVFVVYPIFLSIRTSFDLQNTNTFVGFANYTRFFTDPAAGQIIGQTFLRAFGGVIPSYLLGLAAALALNQRIKGRPAARILILVPFVISAPVALNMWSALLNSETGIPAALGIHTGNLLANPDTVWPTLLIINAWASFQFYTIMLLVGLARVPTEMYDAAETDGASRLQRLRYLTLPSIGPITLLACLLHFMGSFQEFNLIYVLTGGGPLGRTQTLATYSYAEAFSDFDTGYATAITTISLLIMLATIGIIWFVGRTMIRMTAPLRSYENTRSGPIDRLVLASRRRRVLRDSRKRSMMKNVSRRRKASGLALPTVVAWVLVAVALSPILFMLSRSFDATLPGQAAISIWPRQWTLGNYSKVLGNPDLWSSNNASVPPLAVNFVNSIIVTAATTVLVLILSVLCGYALSRWKTRASRVVLALLVALQLVPPIVLIYPLYSILASFHLLGTQLGLVLATSTSFVAMGTLLFRVFFDGIPRELEESAALDGAGIIRTLLQIVLPLSKPAIGAVGAFTLINTWNEYLFATTLVTDGAQRTFPAALQQYMSSFEFTSQSTPGMQAVYFLIPIAVAVILLSFTQKHLATPYQSGSFNL